MSVIFTQAGGAPLAGAEVAVYYLPFSPAAKESDPEMASGTTNAAGQFTAALDTSMVQMADLAQTSAGGKEAFNALAVAESGSQVAAEAVVVSYGGSTTAQARARRSRANTSGRPDLPDSVQDTIVATTYRYVTIAALNSADGVQAGLQYTYTSQTGRQTTLGVAISYDGGSWSVEGSMVEQTNRTIVAPWRHWNSYHQQIFANYYWADHLICLDAGRANRGCSGFENLWEPDHFAGQVTDDNPNIERNGQVIGHQAYQVPNFTNCGGNCWFILSINNSGWGRASGVREGYKWSMADAGFLGLDAWATYGSITYVHWYYLRSGCGGGYARVIWGNKIDPGAARVVQADCMPTPTP